MAVLEVLAWPNEFLRRKARAVTTFDADLHQLVADMTDTMAAEDGVGLAATQVGRDLQLLLLHPVAFRGDEAQDEPTIVVINPEIAFESPEHELGEEGCLSFPEIFIPVSRPLRATIRAVDLDGKAFELTGEGLGARAILHEIDHLNGVVMIDHVSFLQKQRALKKHQKNQADRAAAKRKPAPKT